MFGCQERASKYDWIVRVRRVRTGYVCIGALVEIGCFRQRVAHVTRTSMASMSSFCGRRSAHCSFSNIRLG